MELGILDVGEYLVLYYKLLYYEMNETKREVKL